MNSRYFNDNLTGFVSGLFVYFGGWWKMKDVKLCSHWKGNIFFIFWPQYINEPPNRYPLSRKVLCSHHDHENRQNLFITHFQKIAQITHHASYFCLIITHHPYTLDHTITPKINPNHANRLEASFTEGEISCPFIFVLSFVENSNTPLYHILCSDSFSQWQKSCHENCFPNPRQQTFVLPSPTWISRNE